MRESFLLLVLALLPTVTLASTIAQLQIEIDQQQYARATSTGLGLLRQQPENTRALFLTALAFQRNAQPQQAARYYRELIQLQPDLPEPHNNLAIIEMQNGNPDAAADLLIDSLQTHPAYATAWQNLSNLYRGLASEAYRRALTDDTAAGKQTPPNIDLTALTRLHVPLPQAERNRPRPKRALAPVTELAEQPQVPAQSITVNEPDPTSSPIDDPSTRTQDTLTLPEAILVDTLETWANAWSGKDFDRYINAYTADYQGRQPSHEAWVKHRRARVMKPGKIRVEISEIRVKSFSESRAVVDFHQAYSSPAYRDKAAKRVVLIRRDDQWLIQRESTLAVL